MPKFSTKSRNKLETCHQDLQTLFDYVITYTDCTVVHGHRTAEEQFELFKKGRVQIDGVWVVEDKSKVVTYKNGTTNKSRHNDWPSTAIDAVPYPIDWGNIERFIVFGELVLGLADVLFKYGQMEHKIEWGGHWKWKDYPHSQIKI